MTPKKYADPGDESNAGYWYQRAGRPHSRAPLSEEWDEIASALLA